MDTDINNVVLSTVLLREGQQGEQIVPSWISATSFHTSMGKGSSCALTMHLSPGSATSRNLASLVTLQGYNFEIFRQCG